MDSYSLSLSLNIYIQLEIASGTMIIYSSDDLNDFRILDFKPAIQ